MGPTEPVKPLNNELILAQRFVQRLARFPGGKSLANAIERGEVNELSAVSRGIFSKAFAVVGIPVLCIEALVAWQLGFTALSATIGVTIILTMIAVVLTWNQIGSSKLESGLHVLGAYIVLFGGLAVVLIYEQPFYVVWGSLFIPISYFFLGSRKGFLAIAVFGCSSVALMIVSPSFGWVEVPPALLRRTMISFAAFCILLGVFQLTTEAFESAAVIMANKLEKLADTDPLTGLYNRRRLTSELSHRIAEFERSGKTLALVLIDIDQFKSINDRQGHQRGDEILRGIAGLLQEQVRESDLVGRWGGEEFLLLLPCTDVEGGTHLADKLRDHIGKKVYTDVGTITASFGVSVCSEGDTMDSLIDRADKAMYRAKQNGRNRVEVAKAA